MNSDNPPPVGQEPVPQMPPPSTTEPVKKSRKKLYALIGTVAVAAVLIAVLLVSISQVPQGLGQTIPYGVNYNVGENLTYSLSLTASANGQQVTETGSLTMQIVGFDGENYTINESTNYNVEGSQYSYSYTLIMNKAGQIVGSQNLPSQLQSEYSFIMGSPGNSMFLNRTQIQVGQTMQIPINLNNGTMSMSGTENVKVADIENVTVAAGTYKTFRMDISANNFQVTSQGMTGSVSLNAHVHMDYNTCRVVEFDAQVTSSSEGETVNIAVSMALTSDSTP